MSDAASTETAPLEPRQRAARWILVGSGALSLVLFLAMPLLEVRTFDAMVTEPAYLAAETSGAASRPEVLRDGTQRSSPRESLAIGLQLAEDAPRLGSTFAPQMRVIGRMLFLISAAYLVVALACGLVPLWRGPHRVEVNALASAAALFLVATHVTTVGADLALATLAQDTAGSGAGDGALFSGWSHVLTGPLVLGLGLGTMLAMTARQALRVVAWSLGLFVVCAVACGAWIVL